MIMWSLLELRFIPWHKMNLIPLLNLVIGLNCQYVALMLTVTKMFLLLATVFLKKRWKNMPEFSVKEEKS
ncbi:hypothetical protein SDC9_206822 [bioreactor metagenome]|uniref:Uncharacterized protein n=1 Tax=bioreactor metagenome TaxID=1076179 RepID=A0A645JFI4_9ZZZZ